MLTTGKVRTTRPLARRKELLRTLRRRYSQTPATLHKRARRVRSDGRRLLRRGSRRSLLQGLQGLPDGSLFVDYERYMEDRTADLRRIGTVTFIVGSEQHQQVRDEIDALFAEVLQGYRDYIMRGETTFETLQAAESIRDKWLRLYMYAQGQLDVKVTVKEPGILDQLKDTLSKMGTGAAIGAVVLGAVLLFTRR